MKLADSCQPCVARCRLAAHDAWPLRWLLAELTVAEQRFRTALEAR